MLAYRITYEAEQYQLEGYFNFVEDQRILDKDYMNEFYETIKKEQKAIEEERIAEAQEDANEEAMLKEEGITK